MNKQRGFIGSSLAVIVFITAFLGTAVVSDEMHNHAQAQQITQ